MTLTVKTHHVQCASGEEVGRIEAITHGGGTERVEVANHPDDRSHDVVHPLTSAFHVWLYDPLGGPNTVEMVDTFEKAEEMAEAHAKRIDENAGLIEQTRAALAG